MLIALCCYVDPRGQCWPSQGTISRSLGCSRQAVAQQIASLKRLGYVTVQRRKRAGGGWGVNVYRVVSSLEPPAPPLNADTAALGHDDDDPDEGEGANDASR